MEPARTLSRPNGLGSASGPASASASPQSRRRRNHRGGKKKKNKSKSFAPDEVAHEIHSEGLDKTRSSFFHGRNLSNESLDSQILLDHREQKHFLRPRRASMMGSVSQPSPSPAGPIASRLSSSVEVNGADPENEVGNPWDEEAPLLSPSHRHESNNYGSSDRDPDRAHRSGQHSRRDSSRASNQLKLLAPIGNNLSGSGYDVNYPPSVPGSPPLRASDRFDNVMIPNGMESRSNSLRRSENGDGRGDVTSFKASTLERRHPIALGAEEDVCFPQEGLSDLADEDMRSRDRSMLHPRRRRRDKWPDLTWLEELSRLENLGRTEERQVKRITEPQLINGRLRPVNRSWYKSEDDVPYRLTYFNEEFESTIHSQTISELVQTGGTFRALFVPNPPLLFDSSSESDEDILEPSAAFHDLVGGQNGDSRVPTRQPSLATTSQSQLDAQKNRILSPRLEAQRSSSSRHTSGNGHPADLRSPGAGAKFPVNETRSPQQRDKKPPKYGDRPIWWLDVLSPTEKEMKAISRAFGIHPLTTEDIMVQEQREKVELFRHYYFVNYRTFDQLRASERFMDPVNMYVVVFREGVISFHFSVIPHPANVRRRIRQLRDYLVLTSDWISYAIIDDITDAFGPSIQHVEDEVDDIDDAILRLHSDAHAEHDAKYRGNVEKSGDCYSETGTILETSSGMDMLRRVGDCRKKVMTLYRLLGNKADVIKGFAKRCNEHWDVAPRSDIGLYLGDIQDHIVTMTSNLSHYEKILARSHANYLAQINIRMNERQEKTADVLGKLTVLGTIVLPMNIITGLWGMNVWVPGQEYEGDLKWFFAITAGLLFFGVACYVIAKRVYGIV